jgi:hypothetical protein
MAVKTYDPDKVAVVFGVPITGFGPDTFVSIEYDEDAFTKTIGIDGESCRAKAHNKGAKVTITLMQSSASNDYLSALFNADNLSTSGDGILPLAIKDFTGNTSLIAETAWIMKLPTTTFAREVEMREWTFDTDSLEGIIGGN